jgi:hypothetical protein
MYSIDGTDLGTTVSKAEADANCLVYDSTGGNVGIPVVRVAPNLRPYIIFGESHDSIWKFAKWTGAAWTVTNIYSTTDISMFERADFIINSNTDIEAYIDVNTLTKPTKGGYLYPGGNVWKYRSVDTGATWMAEESVYFGGNMVCNPKKTLNHSTDLKMIFGEPYVINGAEHFNVKLKLYAWGDKGYVYRRTYW